MMIFRLIDIFKCLHYTFKQMLFMLNLNIQFIMFKRIFLLGSTISVLGTIYAVHNDYLRIDIENNNFKSAFRFMHQQNPNYAKKLFKKLIQFQILQSNSNQLLKKWVVGHGFDIQGNLILGLKKLGFGGVELGPTSFSPTPQEYEGNFHLGINYIRANVNTVRQRMSSQKDEKQFKIGVNIAPDYQVAKFTPYILKENILNCMQLILENKQLFDFVVLNFNEQSQRVYIESIAQEHPQIINQITVQCRKMIEKQQVNEKSKLIKLYLQVNEKARQNFQKNTAIDQILVFKQRKIEQILDKPNNINLMYYEDIIQMILQN